jgi:hypothetical protein
LHHRSQLLPFQNEEVANNAGIYFVGETAQRVERNTLKQAKDRWLRRTRDEDSPVKRLPAGWWGWTTLRIQLAGEDIIDIAPDPAFAAFDGADQGVVLVLIVLAGVTILGRVTAADVSADHAHTQVHPGVSGLHTLFANMFGGFPDLDLIEMSARGCHKCFLTLLRIPDSTTDSIGPKPLWRQNHGPIQNFVITASVLPSA